MERGGFELWSAGERGSTGDLTLADVLGFGSGGDLALAIHSSGDLTLVDGSGGDLTPATCSGSGD